MELSTKDLISVGEDNIVNEVVGSINKVGGAKSKNLVMPNFLAKSKLFVKPSFKLGFLTSRARLTFTKLRQAFIKAQIFYHFNPKYHICIETDLLGYAISKTLSQLALDDLT